MMCIRVDLPEPDAPMIATYSPAWITKLTSRRARTTVSPSPYTFETRSIAMTGTVSFIRERPPGHRR